MLTIWLIEYEGKKAGGPGTRLPVAVLLQAMSCSSVTGLVAWIGYLYADDDRLARAALVVLAAVALLGLTMLRRWVSVYRDRHIPEDRSSAWGPGRRRSWSRSPPNAIFRWPWSSVMACSPSRPSRSCC